MTSTSEAMDTGDLIARAEEGLGLARPEIVHLLSLDDPAEIEALYQAADRVRRRCVGDEVHLRGVIEFSNHCRNNCTYCGLRRDNAKLARYRMEDDEIVECALGIAEGPCGTVVLQAGEDPAFTAERLCGIISAIRARTPLAVTLSVGRWPYEDLKAFRDAGASRYLLRHETANASLYESLCPGRRLSDRIECIRHLKRLGFETGMGCMVGLPGQTVEDLASDILLMQEMDADMIGIGPFIPHGDTPLAGHPPGDAEMVLKMLAVTRLVTRDTNIPATTALGVLRAEARKRAFFAGANVFMPVYTPKKYAPDYQIYPGKAVSVHEDMPLQEVVDYFSSIGRPIGAGHGARRKR